MTRKPKKFSLPLGVSRGINGIANPWPSPTKLRTEYDDDIDDIFGPPDIFDPNNWLRIPEFDVVPAPALDFRGYLDSERAKHPEFVPAARRLIRSSRVKVRRVFLRMHELRDAWAKYLELVDLYVDHSWDMPPATEATRIAVFYNVVVEHLEDVMRASTKEAAIASFVDATALFADWSEDDTSKLLPQVKSEAMRALAKRRKVKGTPDLFAAFASARGFPSIRSRKQLIDDAQDHFDVSERTIERWYAAAQEKNLLP